MDEKLIKTVALKNGLELEVLDGSRKIAGDRWQVVLTFRIDIPVKDFSAADCRQVGVDAAEILASVGEKVSFEQKRERNFVAADRKDDVLKDLYDTFADSSLAYVSNPDFPKRCILRQHRENLRRKSWYAN